MKDFNMKDHHTGVRNLTVAKRKPEKNSGLNRIRTHEPANCGSSAVLLPTGVIESLGRW